MMLFERARWPVNDSPLVAAAPWSGVRSLVTPGVMAANPMKLRPLIGSESIWCCLTTVPISMRPVDANVASVVTVTAVVRVLQLEREVHADRLSERELKSIDA